MVKLYKHITSIIKNPILINSSWGVISQLLQSVLLSLFFVLMARYYTPSVLSEFIVTTVLCQLVSAFSTLGLSQWFIREITATDDKKAIVSRFLQLQFFSGIFFYVVNIVFAFLLYGDQEIHLLAIFLGLNIVFDNLVNAIKCINISEFNQKKSFVIFTTEAFLKFLLAGVLFIAPLSIITFSFVLVLVRFVTLNLFLTVGSSRSVHLKMLFPLQLPISYIVRIIKKNWSFIILGSISIVNWRISTLIISKVLSADDVANFEICFRMFSIALMLPVAVSDTIFPSLIRLYKEGKMEEFNSFYRKMHLYYAFFGLFCFTFIYSYAKIFLPFVFGIKYHDVDIYSVQMFLTILVFPTAFLQANVLVALKLEKLDMWFNVINLTVNLLSCMIGLYLFKSLSVITISIFAGFIVFQLLQDFVLIKNKISSMKSVVGFYTLTISLIGSYILLDKAFNTYFFFIVFWVLIIGIFTISVKFRQVSKVAYPA
jgi:O-antigen/teichoic acid export membrane protein